MDKRGLTLSVIIFLTLVSILGLYLVRATWETEVIDAHGQNLDNPYSDDEMWGEVINTSCSTSTKINSIGVHTSSSPTNGWIINYSNNATLASCTFVGKSCNFNMSSGLPQDTKLYILVGLSSSNSTPWPHIQRNAANPGYPILGTNIKWIKGVYNYPSSILYSGINDIVNLTTQCEFSEAIPPNVTTPLLNSTNGSNRTNQDLVCYATLTDNSQTTLTAYWKWYKNNVSYLSGSKTNVQNGSHTLITTLAYGNTSKGEKWICEVKPYDGYQNGTAKNSSELIIQNTAPTIPVQLLPQNNSGYSIGSTIIFSWENSTDEDGDNRTYELEIYNESDMSAEHLIYENNSISEGTSNTSIAIKLSDYTTVNDNYYWRIRAYDQDYSYWSTVRIFQYANWSITFNLTDSGTEELIQMVWPYYFDVSCSNGYSSSNNHNNPYTLTNIFAPGNHNCTFSERAGYYTTAKSFSINNDGSVVVEMLRIGGLTPEEHTWLEAIYECIINKNCDMYNLLLEMNNTMGNIWEHTKPTDESVILFENVTNKEVNSTQNLTIDYVVHIPVKAGYSLGDYLPIRIGYWFLNPSNTTCYNQGDKPTGVEEPYCQPLIIETLGPMGGNVSFTVKLHPSLSEGNYSIKRIIDIDPLGIWYNYGQDFVGDFTMLESLSNYGIDLETTGESNPKITGSIIKNLLNRNGNSFLILLGIIGGIVIAFGICKKIKKKINYN